MHDSNSLLSKAESGDVESQYLTGLMYISGEGVKEDSKKAFKWFSRSAEHGHARAQLALAHMYMSGRGVKADSDKYLEWCMKAAESGLVEAQYSLGYTYENGNHIKEDLTKAVEWYLKAAEQNYPKAWFSLGAIYLLEDSVKDPQLAFEYLSKAADAGNKDAEYDLYLMYSLGIGMDAPNDFLGYSHLKKAATEECPDALFALACIYDKGGPYAMQDKKKAFELYERGAAVGDLRCATSLGTAYLFGFGTPQNHVRAAKILGLAADCNVPEAMNNLGIMYLNGIGVDADPSKAFEYFQKASDMDFPESMSNLGSMYAMGLGAKKDEVKAKELFQAALNKGYEPASKNLEALKEGATQTTMLVNDGESLKSFRMSDDENRD